MSKKMLVIAPHADDEVLGCAGAIQHYKKEGYEIFVNIVSNRILNHTIDKEHIVNTKKCTEEVAKLLGIKNVSYCDLNDEQLDNRLIDIIVPLEAVINNVNPNIVFVPNITDTDQDHRSVANACLVACRSISTVFSYEIPGPSIDFQPNYYLDIEQYFNLKITAMEKYSDEWRTYPHPRSPEGIKVVAQYRGIQSGFNYAEAYKLIKHNEKSMNK
jgi:LmbE family N-acetylglucosaminyl deacetylase